jgi:hypothetical protein
MMGQRSRDNTPTPDDAFRRIDALNKEIDRLRASDRRSIESIRELRQAAGGPPKNIKGELDSIGKKQLKSGFNYSALAVGVVLFMYAFMEWFDAPRNIEGFMKDERVNTPLVALLTLSFIWIHKKFGGESK